MREKHSGEAVGITGFRPQWVPYRQAVGYGSLPAGQGGLWQGVAAGGAGFCGERLRLSQADRHRDRGQPASRGLLESCGFQLEGTLRDNFRLAGQWYDDWLFGLLAAEFQGGK